MINPSEKTSSVIRLWWFILGSEKLWQQIQDANRSMRRDSPAGVALCCGQSDLARYNWRGGHVVDRTVRWGFWRFLPLVLCCGLPMSDCSNPKKDRQDRQIKSNWNSNSGQLCFLVFSRFHCCTHVWYGWSYHTLYYSTCHRQHRSDSLVRGSTCHRWCGSHQPSVQHHLFSGGLFAQPRHPVCGWGAACKGLGHQLRYLHGPVSVVMICQDMS